MGEGQAQEARGRSWGVTGTTDSDASGARRTSDDERPAAQAAGPFVVYCGGCNPQIDRGALASELAASPAFVRPGASVYLSGCPRACASDHRLAFTRSDGDERDASGPSRAADRPAVVVAGAHVDGVPTPPQDIAATVIDKLKE